MKKNPQPESARALKVLLGLAVAALTGMTVAAVTFFLLWQDAVSAKRVSPKAERPGTEQVTELGRKPASGSEVKPPEPLAAPAPPPEVAEAKPQTESQQPPEKQPEALPDPPPPRISPKEPLERAVLREADFEYLGAFALPKKACGFSTQGSAAGLAVRRVGGTLRLITASHRYSHDALFEVELPGWGTQMGKWPEAKSAREWGTAVYKGEKGPVRGGQGIDGHGLYYEEATGRLYFSFASWYNIPPLNSPSLGYALLNEAGPKAFGPWKAPESTAHCQKIRGGSLAIPKWFADRFTGGRTLGLGFGGYYSGVQPCSWGPFLAAAIPPQRAGADLDVLPLLDHPPNHKAVRDPDYRTEIGWDSNPKGGDGYWGAMDEIFGGGTWIDLPDKHGLLYVATLGHGRIWYESSDRHAERIEPWWFVYDPRDLAAVARRQKSPWIPRPTFWKVDYQPVPVNGKQKWITSGCTFDAPTRTLFILVPHSYKTGVEWYPLVHGWRVK
jgi:hypothetical protein